MIVAADVLFHSFNPMLLHKKDDKRFIVVISQCNL